MKNLIMKKNITILLIIFLLANTAFCAAPTAQFLLIAQGARAEAMGGSVTAHCFDNSAVYWNPAALPFLRQGEIGVANTQFPTSITHNFISIVYPYKYFGFGINTILFNSSMDFYDGSGTKIRNGKGEKSIYHNVSLAYRISPLFSMGLNLGLVSMELYNSFGADYKDSALSAGAHGLYKKNIFSIGFSVHSGEELYFARKEKQPEFFRLGTAYELLGKQRLVLTGSYTGFLANENADSLAGGAELRLFDDIRLRAGYNYKKGTGKALSFGGSIATKKLIFDYAFTPKLASLDLMNYHRAGVSFKFGHLTSLEYKGKFLPPEITLQYLKNNKYVFEPVSNKVFNSKLTIVGKLSSDINTLLDTFAVKSNGKEILTRQHLGKTRYKINETIELEEGVNVLEICAVDSNNNIGYSKKINIEYERDILKGDANMKDFIDFVSEKGKNWAVLIGIDDYPDESGFEKLNYVKNDIKTFKDTLINNLENFSEERIFTLGEHTWSINDKCNYAGSAEKRNIESFLGDKLPDKINKDDRVLVFFSGHGLTLDTVHEKKKQGFLAPIDGKKEEPFSTCISMDVINQLSERIPAKQILFIVDACNSGLVLLRNKGDKKDKTLKRRIESFLTQARQAMTAGQSTQSSQISSEHQQSIYTHYLLEGLKGSADSDKDGVVSIHELHTYTYSKVSVSTDNTQTPQMGRLKDGGEGDFFFVLNK
ncbi:caspase family protein [bacterium]